MQMKNIGTISTQDLVPEISPGKVNSSSEALLYISVPLGEANIKALYFHGCWVLAALTARENKETPQGREARSLRRDLLGLVLLNITCI